MSLFQSWIGYNAIPSLCLNFQRMNIENEQEKLKLINFIHPKPQHFLSTNRKMSLPSDCQQALDTLNEIGGRLKTAKTNNTDTTTIMAEFNAAKIALDNVIRPASANAEQMSFTAELLKLRDVITSADIIAFGLILTVLTVSVFDISRSTNYLSTNIVLIAFGSVFALVCLNGSEEFQDEVRIEIRVDDVLGDTESIDVYVSGDDSSGDEMEDLLVVDGSEIVF